MFQSSSRGLSPRATRFLPGLAAALVLSTLTSGCSDRESSVEASVARTAEKPTSRDLFINDCAACHGVDGSGNGPLAAELKVAPINLRLLKQSNNGRFPTRSVQHSIDGTSMARAHGLPDMPVWGRQWILEGLSDAERKARAISITSYISTIQD